MPQIKSAIKRVKTQAVANERNAAQLSTMRTAVKKFKVLKLLVRTTPPNYTLLLSVNLDKAASKGFDPQEQGYP